MGAFFPLFDVAQGTELFEDVRGHLWIFSGGGTEVSGNGYARIAVSSADGSWSAPSGTPRAIANASTLYFSPNPTAGWGTVTHFGVYDALSGGNLLYWAALGTSKTVNAGDTVSFPAGAITISED